MDIEKYRVNTTESGFSPENPLEVLPGQTLESVIIALLLRQGVEIGCTLYLQYKNEYLEVATAANNSQAKHAEEINIALEKARLLRELDKENAQVVKDYNKYLEQRTEILLGTKS